MSFLVADYPRHVAVWCAVEAQLPLGELAHDASHIARVYRWALRLAPEALADGDCAGAMALVHDLAFIPKDSPDRALGGERSAHLAGAVLTKAGYAIDEVSAIAEAVRTSSWSRGFAPTNALGVVLQDADRLDAIGAVGLMRTFACGQFMSSAARPGRFYHADDPCAQSGRVIDDRTYAVDHCYAKLLLLAAGMHLPSAQQEAKRRHAAMESFLAQMQADISG
jgi:uncharacterized protein